jgi:hypothetical protein
MKKQIFTISTIIRLLILTTVLTISVRAQNQELQSAVENQRVESNAAVQVPKKRNDLTGVWLVNVQENASTANLKSESFSQAFQIPQAASGAGALAPFTSLNTFHTDGTFIEGSLADYFPPQGTPGQGLWARTGEGEFNLTFYGVLYGSSNNPQFQGTYRVRSRIITNEAGDQFSAPGKIDIFGPNGNLLFTFDSFASGKRADIVPLQ